MVDKKAYLYVGASYKSTDQAEVDEILMVIKQASNNHILIVDDFNYSAINLENLGAVNKERKCVDLVQDWFLVQHVQAPNKREYCV